MTVLEVTELIISVVQLRFKKQQFLARNPNVKEKILTCGSHFWYRVNLFLWLPCCESSLGQSSWGHRLSGDSLAVSVKSGADPGGFPGAFPWTRGVLRRDGEAGGWGGRGDPGAAAE